MAEPGCDALEHNASRPSTAFLVESGAQQSVVFGRDKALHVGALTASLYFMYDAMQPSSVM